MNSTRWLSGAALARIVTATLASVAVTVSTALTGGLWSADAAPLPASGRPVQGTQHTGTGLGAPWAREVIREGARDAGPHQIQHVRELQYRLKFVGLYHGVPTGVFGPATLTGVKAFQQRKHLPVTGVMTTTTWARLLQATLRNVAHTPAVCKTPGWHACYDRSVHAVNLWHDAKIYNTWLVRGGESGLQTRLGTHRVYYRDIDHVSGEYGSPMPYSQFFDGGEALHGSALMTDPFVGHSHGCINMYIEDARQLWNLTHAVTLWVTVYGTWS
jgi:hypothetical protein